MLSLQDGEAQNFSKFWGFFHFWGGNIFPWWLPAAATRSVLLLSAALDSEYPEVATARKEIFISIFIYFFIYFNISFQSADTGGEEKH